MSADVSPPQPMPQPPQPGRRGGCGRRGCLIGCILVLISCVLLVVAIWIGVVSLIRYVESRSPEAAPCALMRVWLEIAEYGLENPGLSSGDAAEMRRAYAQIQAEYQRTCATPSSRLV